MEQDIIEKINSVGRCVCLCAALILAGVWYISSKLDAILAKLKEKEK